MERGNQRFTTGRTISLSGLLGLLCGFGTLYAFWKFSHLTRDWNDVARLLVVVVGALLLVVGLQKLLSESHLLPNVEFKFRLSRHRVMLPRVGFVYLLIMIVFFIGSLLGRSNMLMLVFAFMIGPVHHLQRTA